MFFCFVCVYLERQFSLSKVEGFFLEPQVFFVFVFMCVSLFCLAYILVYKVFLFAKLQVEHVVVIVFMVFSIVLLTAFMLFFGLFF